MNVAFAFEMVQRQKDEVRARLIAAGRGVFAEVGFETATVAAIAERAGVSTGNVYRYFGSKEELLEEVLPASFVRKFRGLVRARVDALAGVRDIGLLAAGAEYFAAADRLFEFCVAERERVVFLLSGARGTEWEGFAQSLCRDLERWALVYARRAWPKLRPSAALRFTLREVYRSYVGSLAHALKTYTSRAALEDAVAHLSGYHLAGMKQLFETAMLAAEVRRRRPMGGVGTRGVGTRGVGARGVGARGVGARGVGARGVGTRGVGTRGVGARGVGRKGGAA
ncbi:MAG: helix-turn-helix domain-containing protein [Myxococcota bacterium]